MSKDSVKTVSWGLCALNVMCSLNAAAAPIYPKMESAPAPLVPGITSQIWLDWNSAEPLVANKPDRSFRSFWVRLFPLLSQPLGDPYPDTQNLNEIDLSNSAGFKAYDLANGSLAFSGKNLKFDFDMGVVTVDGKTQALDPIWIAPQGSALTLLNWDKGRTQPNGKPAEVRIKVRGGFVIKPSIHEPRNVPQPNPRELWSVINVIGVNQYIQSVVPSEIISSWHLQTLRAQAIAARTYGLYEVAAARSKGLDFDVDPSTWYQSYQGVEFWNREANTWKQVELKTTTKIVSDTNGQVILHGSDVIKAYFSANSGGRSCSVTECLVGETVDPPYIHEVDDHPNIRNAPGGTWGTRARLSPQTIRDRLAEFGVTLSAPVKRLEHLERGASGRTWRLRVVLQDGSHVDLDRLFTRKVMHLFGPVRSFQYELGSSGSNGNQQIQGFGYGHAVGMSQWGAQLFAKQGWTAHQILRHYYKNVSVSDLAGTKLH